MFTLPKEFSVQISEFAPLFSKKVFEHVKVLLIGCFLVVGRRTVCSCLRAVGLSEEKCFHKYHRVLSRATWSCHKAARILLNLIVEHFFNSSEPLVFGIDETVERRWGQKIKRRGIYRDSVRSSRSHFVKCSGLRWISLMLLTPIKWADRVWALPFLTVLAPSKRYYEGLGKQPKKLTDWARQMMLQLARWLPNRQLIIVADSSYSVIQLLADVGQYVCVITRLRLDAALYDFVPPRPKGKVGRNRKKGERQKNLQDRIEDTQTQWLEIVVPKWYGRNNIKILVATGTALWYHSGMPVVPIRWVLIKSPDNLFKPCALLCTNLDLIVEQIIDFFIRRWTVEVTFQEVRKHLGVETQRQWSDLAIIRTTPILLGLFSLVTIWADQLFLQNQLVIKPCAWYKKTKPTFADAIASIRRLLWTKNYFSMSPFKDDIHNYKPNGFDLLVDIATRAA